MDKPWKVIVAFVGVFVAGAVFGGFGYRYLEAKPPPRSRPEQAISPQLMQRFSERLELTEAQREKLSPVIDKASEELRKVRQTSFREANAIFDRLHEEVARELTPEQREELKQLRERHREAFNRERERRGWNSERRGEGGPGGPRPPRDQAPKSPPQPE